MSHLVPVRKNWLILQDRNLQSLEVRERCVGPEEVSSSARWRQKSSEIWHDTHPAMQKNEGEKALVTRGHTNPTEQQETKR